MKQNVANQKLNDTDLFILAESTCIWWNNVITQSNRFFNAYTNNKGGTPWQENETQSIFCAERLFLIITIHNAIEYLRKFNIELQRHNDNSMQEILDIIDQTIPNDSITKLRNMNIHHLDYLVGKGHDQNNFRTKYESNNKEHLTTAAWTVNDNNHIYIGNVNITLLIDILKQQVSSVRAKSLEVYNNLLYPSN